jgi:hypothetical protein
MANAPGTAPHRGAVILLTVLVTVSWVATVVLPLLVLRLLLGIEAPTDRVVPIVLGWFATPALAAAGLTVGLVILRRSRGTGAPPRSP